jgi:hypothetical protein
MKLPGPSGPHPFKKKKNTNMYFYKVDIFYVSLDKITVGDGFSLL